MKELFRILKESDKLGYKLSAICGVNWLVGQFFRWQSLVFEMIACAVLIKEISAILEISSNYLVSLMSLFILASPFLKLRFGVERFIFYFMRNFVLLWIFSKALDFPFQENESELWILIFLFSIGIYQFMKWFQAKLFLRYLFKNVLNKDYLGIRKLRDELPPKINLLTDADEGDANQRMITINQRAVKKDYQDIVELSFLNYKRFTGLSHYRVTWKGFEAPFKSPLKKGFSDVDEMYHLVFSVYPFGKKHDFYFELIQFNVSKKSAFSMKGEFVFTNK